MSVIEMWPLKAYFPYLHFLLQKPVLGCLVIVQLTPKCQETGVGKRKGPKDNILEDIMFI